MVLVAILLAATGHLIIPPTGDKAEGAATSAVRSPGAPRSPASVPTSAPRFELAPPPAPTPTSAPILTPARCASPKPVPSSRQVAKPRKQSARPVQMQDMKEPEFPRMLPL